ARDRRISRGQAMSVARPRPWAFVLFLGVIAAFPADAAAYGPRIRIWADGDIFLDTRLRDSEVVSAEHLGAYLGRLTFRSTKKLAIKPSDGNPMKASLMSKFEL